MNVLYAQTHPVEWECQALTQAAEGRGQQAMDGQPRCRDSLHSVTTEKKVTSLFCSALDR